MEAKLKHLEFIQATIARMATNSFLFKGWAITIAAGLSAFAAADNKEAVLAMAVVSTLLFWGLDGYYLWLERGFIRLHAQVSLKNEAEVDFSMLIDKSDALRRWAMTCWRPHLVMFYGIIVAVDVIGILLIRSQENGA